MCQIFHLPPGVEIPKQNVLNSIHTNPHGWGLVVRHKDEMEIKKVFEKDGTDPDKVMNHLEMFKSFDKFLHLRWATVGDKTEDNCHPFVSYQTPKKKIVMMHNGTLYNFKGEKDSTVSDTHNFNENFLKPLLKRFRGDIHDPLFREIAEKFTNDNRIILIPNKGVPVFLNEAKWKFQGPKTSYQYVMANTYSLDRNHRKPATNADFFRSWQNGQWQKPATEIKWKVGDIVKLDIAMNHGKQPLTKGQLLKVVKIQQNGHYQMVFVEGRDTPIFADRFTEATYVEKKQYERANKGKKNGSKVMNLPAIPPDNKEKVVDLKTAKNIKESEIEEVSDDAENWFLVKFGVDYLEDAALITKKEWESLQQDQPEALIRIVMDLAYQLAAEEDDEDAV